MPLSSGKVGFYYFPGLTASHFSRSTGQTRLFMVPQTPRVLQCCWTVHMWSPLSGKASPTSAWQSSHPSSIPSIGRSSWTALGKSTFLSPLHLKGEAFFASPVPGTGPSAAHGYSVNCLTSEYVQIGVQYVLFYSSLEYVYIYIHVYQDARAQGHSINT